MTGRELNESDRLLLVELAKLASAQAQIFFKYMLLLLYQTKY